MSDSFATPYTVARQAPLSMGFPRKEYSSGTSKNTSPEDLPDPGIQPQSPAWQEISLPLSHLGSPSMNRWMDKKVIVFSYNGILLRNKSNELLINTKCVWVSKQLYWISRDRQVLILRIIFGKLMKKIQLFYKDRK